MALPTKTLRSALTAAGVAGVTGGILLFSGIKREIAAGAAGIAGITAGISNRRKSGMIIEDSDNNKQETDTRWFQSNMNSQGGITEAADNWEIETARCDRGLEIEPHNADLLYRRGVAKNNLGDYIGAIEDYDKVLEVEPDDANAYFNRAVSKGEIGDSAGAIEDYSKAIEKNPDHYLAYYNRGIEKSDSGESEDCVNDFRRAIEIKPEYIDAYYRRGIALREQGLLLDAIDDFTRIIALDGASTEGAHVYQVRGFMWGELGEWEKQIKDYSKAIEIGSVEEDLYLDRAFAYYNAGLHESAITDFGESIESRQENRFIAFSNRGNALFSLGRYEEAMRDYSSAISLQAENPDVFYNRARACQEGGEIQNAITDFDSAIRIDPQNIDYIIDRGIAWEQLGEKEKAIEDFTNAISITPDSYRAHLLRGKAERDIGRLDNAIRDFTRAIEIAPTLAEAIKERGFTYVKAVEYELAINDYTTAISISSDDYASYYCRAVWKRKSGDIKGALDDLSDSIRLNPDYPNPYTERAEILFEERKYEDSLRDMNQVGVFRLWITDMRDNVERLEGRVSAIEELTDGYEKDQKRKEWQTDSRNLYKHLTGNYLLGILVCSEIIERNPGNKVAMINLLKLHEYAGDKAGVAIHAEKFRGKIGVETLVYLLIRNDLDDQALALLKDETGEDKVTESIRLRLGEQYFALGHSYLEQQENSKIIRPMTKAIELGISGEVLQKAYANRAAGYLSTKQYKECIDDIDLFFSMEYYEPLASLQCRLISDRSFCKQQLGDLEGALVDAKMAVNLNRSSIYLNDLGNIQQEVGRHKEAISSFTEAFSLAPEDAFILTNRANAKDLRGDFVGALDDYTKAIENGDLTAYYNRGNLRLNKLQDYDGAIADFTSAINCDACTDKHYYYYNRAFAKHLKADLAGALEDCDLAHGADPNYIKPIRLKAKTHFQLGELPQAREWYLKILKRNGEDFYDWNELGTIENNLDNHELAVAYLDKSIEINLGDERVPSDTDVLAKSSYYLSHSFYRLGEYQDAVTVAFECEQYCELNGEYVRVLACVYDEMGDSAMALETINRAITLDDSSAEIWYDRGVIRRDIGDLEGALEDFKKAIAINPSFTSAYHNIGSIAWRDLGNREMGCSYWKKAADLGDEDSKDLYTKNCVTPGVSDAFPGISDL